jgi:hypothetical protein
VEFSGHPQLRDGFCGLSRPDQRVFRAELRQFFNTPDVLSPARPGDAVAGSPRFDTEFVVDRYSQTLPAANIAFRGLHRDMAEKKLNLLELASRIMAKPRA